MPTVQIVLCLTDTSVKTKQPAGAAGQIGHVGTPLLEDQIEAGAWPIPAFLEGCDAPVAAANFE